MKAWNVIVEVLTNGEEYVIAYETKMPKREARKRLLSAEEDRRAYPSLALDEQAGDVSVSIFNDEEGDLYVLDDVSFPAKVACDAICKHFGWNPAGLREATAAARIARLNEERKDRLSAAARRLGLFENPNDLH